MSIEISPKEASWLQTGQDVVGCEGNNPGHEEIVNNAVPMQPFPPIPIKTRVEISPNGEETQLQRGPVAVGREDINPGLGIMEEKWMNGQSLWKWEKLTPLIPVNQFLSARAMKALDGMFSKIGIKLGWTTLYDPNSA
ncbi:Hypothetical predicted protein [Olea europaea subsp. europaea]|uniref:Uncharacterized protein n=1 Tax=Olea europaea subsp. europaea TaxID=158383 RepID=A0A8S0UER5_OLEEU|nr:Hypothetical predicted protein [Olea europaea subsp. europaea]